MHQVKGSDGVDAPESAAIYVDADVTDESSVKKALAQATKVFGGVDGLVNVPPPPPASQQTGSHGGLDDIKLQSYQVDEEQERRNIFSELFVLRNTPKYEGNLAVIFLYINMNDFGTF